MVFSIWFFNFTLPLRSRRTSISFSYRLASWYVLAYFVPNVYQFIIFKFYIVTSQLELKISYVSSFLRNLVPFAYFARNDFYESKILEILTTRAVVVSQSLVTLVLGTTVRTLYLTFYAIRRIAKTKRTTQKKTTLPGNLLKYN